ncbi:hypothetical protein E4U48_005435 [Claviceps purpurea]|nr:hypothetical protein E4U48_005435 [Claviceps purpurea]
MASTTPKGSPQPDTSATYKDQLDKAAIEEREREQSSKPNPIVEKITEFIPAAAKVLGPKEKVQKEETPVPGPPERPHHDPNIEAFVRDQHKSKEPADDMTDDQE